MYINNLEQLTNFFYFIITGIVLSVIFDIFRILRKTFKTSDILTNIEDVIFGLVTGIVLILSIFLINDGELRLYIFIGISSGITLYMLFISKYFIKINILIINFIKKIIIILTKPFKILIKYIKKMFFKPVSFIFINLKLLIRQKSINFKKSMKINKKTIKEEGF